jgi:hypothetical protein
MRLKTRSVVWCSIQLSYGRPGFFHTAGLYGSSVSHPGNTKAAPKDGQCIPLERAKSSRQEPVFSETGAVAHL